MDSCDDESRTQSNDFSWDDKLDGLSFPLSTQASCERI